MKISYQPIPTPSPVYGELLIQYRALWSLYQSTRFQLQYAKDKNAELQREISLQNTAQLEALYETNQQLTNELEELEYRMSSLENRR
jgi:hypothetical protein